MFHSEVEAQRSAAISCSQYASTPWAPSLGWRKRASLAGDDKRCSVSLEAHQRLHVLAEGADLVGAAEIGKIDYKRASDHVGAGALQQLYGGHMGGGTVGGGWHYPTS